MLREFIASHRGVILAQARLRVAARTTPVPTEIEMSDGLPRFLDQLGEALRKSASHETVDHQELKATAGLHGDLLFRTGLPVAQLVHDYGDLCQVITGLALEENLRIGADEFQTLNLCLDDAIAGAVTAFGEQRERAVVKDDTEKLGVLAHEMRNVLGTALLAFDSIKNGRVAPGGSTSTMLERSLLRMNILIDRSLADVRLDAGKVTLERVQVAEVIEEVEVGAALVAQGRKLHFVAQACDRAIVVDADRAILAAAISNLVQNAFKFTRPDTTVSLGVRTTESRVFIEVRDACGGLAPGDVKGLLLPFTQRDADRTGLGLGLSICVKAMKTMSGALRIEDVPGQGCIFTLDLPKQPPDAA